MSGGLVKMGLILSSARRVLVSCGMSHVAVFFVKAHRKKVNNNKAILTSSTTGILTRLNPFLLRWI